MPPRVIKWHCWVCDSLLPPKKPKERKGKGREWEKQKDGEGGEEGWEGEEEGEGEGEDSETCILEASEINADFLHRHGGSSRLITAQFLLKMSF